MSLRRPLPRTAGLPAIAELPEPPSRGTAELHDTLPVAQSIMPTEMSFVLRTDLPALELAATARRAVYDVDPTLNVARIRTMDAIVSASPRRPNVSWPSCS